MTSGLTLHVGDDLDTLSSELAALLARSDTPVLEPTWIVVSSSAVRQWLDARLSLKWATSTSESNDGVSANLRYLFPEEFVRTVEGAALHEVGRQRVSWDVDTLTLAQLAHSQPRPSYERARHLGESIDLLLRWREDELRSMSPGTAGAREAGEAFRQLTLHLPSPLEQRDAAISSLQVKLPSALPGRVIVFGLSSVPGGAQFVQLICALATHCVVDVLWPTPSVQRAQSTALALAPSPRGLLDPWSRESDESLALWRSVEPHWIFLAHRHEAAGSLGALQRCLRSATDSSSDVDDRSVRLISCVGRSRQVEVLRDIILDAVAAGIEPHDVLVLSPDPTAFAHELERHWNHERGTDAVLPRLAYEMTDGDSSRTPTRLRLSLALLHTIGNYVTRDQFDQLCSFPSVRTALNLDESQIERLAKLASLAPVTFGVSPAQRAAHHVIDPRTTHLRLDAGTWQRLADRVVAATVDPCIDPEGAFAVPEDLTLVGRIQPLLRLLEEASPFRHEVTAQRLRVWTELLERWMNAVSSAGDDSSFERSLTTVRGWLAQSTPSIDFDVELSFAEFSALWSELATSVSQQRVYGRRGVVIAPLTSLQFAPFDMVCILGFDDALLPPASWSHPVLGTRRFGDPDPRHAILASALAATLSARRRLVVTYSGRDESSGRTIERAIALEEWNDALASAVANYRGVETSSRHGFAVPSNDPLAVTTSFDSRFAPTEPQEQWRPSVPDDSLVSLDDLNSFLTRPVNFYLRRTLGAQLPDEPMPDSTVPPISVGALHRSALQRTYVSELASALRRRFSELNNIPLYGHLEHRASVACRAQSCSWLHELTSSLRSDIFMSESATAAVPAQLWHHRLKLPLLDLAAYNYAVDLSDLRQEWTPSFSAENVRLDEGLTLSRSSSTSTLSSDVKWHSGEANSLIGVTLSVRAKSANGPRYLLRLVAQMLMQKIDVPDADVSLTTYFLPDRATAYLKKQDDIVAHEFARNPLASLRYVSSPDQARVDLAVLVELVQRSRSTLVPLFSRTSLAYVRAGHKEARAAWEDGFAAKGECHETAHRLLFSPSYDDLVALSSTNELPLVDELRRALQHVEIATMSQSKRPPARRWRELHPQQCSGNDIAPRFAPVLSSQ